MHLKLLPELTQELFRTLQTDGYRQKFLDKGQNSSDLNNFSCVSYNFPLLYKMHTLPVELCARLDYYTLFEQELHEFQADYGE
jgi:hypothetical protein